MSAAPTRTPVPPPPGGTGAVVAAVPPRGGAGAVVAALFTGLAAIVGTVLTTAGGWIADQVAGMQSAPVWPWTWPVAGLVGGVLVAAPAGLLATIPRSAAIRVTGRAWLVAGVAAAVLGAARAVPVVHHELYLAVVAAVAAVAARLLRGPGAHRSPPAATWLGVAAGALATLPWLWFGAFGGVLETLLGLAAAAGLGALAARMLDAAFWRAHTVSPVRLVLLGGSVAGVALTVLGGAAGHSGPSLAQLLVLPPLGWVLAALHALAARTGPAGSAPVAWTIGIAAVGPLALVDPDEVSLALLTTRDIPAWTALAAGVSWLVGAQLAVAYSVALARRAARVPRRGVAVGVAATVLLTGAGAYAAGQPGFHGERLFVVLREQADLSGVAATGTGPAARDTRVAETYRRLVATARRSQAGLRRDLDRLHLPYTPYYLVNAVEVAGGPEVRAWLARRSDVARVLVSQRLRPLPAPAGGQRGPQTAPPAQPPWGLTRIGATRVHEQLGVTGTGITVGSSDSGVDGAHPALAGTFRGGDDSWYDPWDRTRTPTDRQGHGTHTLATAVGGHGVGVAPGAAWTGCVNLARNLGNPARYLDCLQFMLAPFPPGGDPFTDGRPARAPHVLTNSWGCPTVEGCDARALRPAVAAFSAAGIFFVAAAGNSGPGCGSLHDPPAPYAESFTVGAVDAAGSPADFSSRGPAPGGATKPDLVAPGVDVVSALPGGTYGPLDGTSMAAPHVAGVVALLWSAQPALVGDLDRTRRLLTSTASPVRVPADTCGAAAAVTGAGTVDAWAAVQAARG